MHKFIESYIYTVWYFWHSQLPRFFDRLEAGRMKRRYNKAKAVLEAICPEESNSMVDLYIPPFRDEWASYFGETRPAYHCCCNGDSGGWRTAVCDWLEGLWRHSQSINDQSTSPE